MNYSTKFKNITLIAGIDLEGQVVYEIKEMGYNQ
jgi:hypothetical protein